MTKHRVMIDGNEAAASVAHRLSEVIAIYPITPSSPMGELSDEWSATGRANLWGSVPTVIEMQSEGGAAGALHGAIQTGALSTTFTASQGLLLMIPNMFKIAGELTPTVFHVSARTVATHALSIFGDHSDVMAARSTGFAMLASGNAQETMDLAAVAHAGTLEARVPFLHFFDGFRTSHELMQVAPLSNDDLRALIEDRFILEHRARAMSPQHPVLRGSAQNPDVFFQAREAVNPFYRDCPAIVEKEMQRLERLTGRRYRLFDYVGHPQAERVIVLMGSGAETAHEAVEDLVARGEKVGLVKVRLFRPFDGEKFIASLPATTRAIAVLDRTKEPGAPGEPLYQDVVTALMERVNSRRGGFDSPTSEEVGHPGELRSIDGMESARSKEFGKLSAVGAVANTDNAVVPCDIRGFFPGSKARGSLAPQVIGGRYGLSSKEFTPAMVKAVFDELNRPNPKNHFTVGITDDVTHTSLAVDESFITEDEDSVRAVFYGLGSDGTVGANKNTVKIIGGETDRFVQGYFVYDSKKAGSVTVSHLRFGKRPIRSSYLIQRANFIACHQQTFVDRLEMLSSAAKGATFLLNTQARPEEVWETLPHEAQEALIERQMRFFVIDAYDLAKELGLGSRINTIMQTCFFAISGVLPREEAVAKIKKSIAETYGRKGEKVVQRNFAAVDRALENLHEVPVSREVMGLRRRPPVVPQEAPRFVREVTARILAGQGDRLPVSALPVDGTFPTDTARWEKRNIALEIPAWDPPSCIQCNKCVLVCPHAAIRANVYDGSHLENAPATFKHVVAKGAEFKGLHYTLQVAPEDCTGCGLCVEFCPVHGGDHGRIRAINMAPQPPLRDAERENFRFFLELPEFDRTKLKTSTVKGSQFLLPLFEFSGACAGCGETPYVKLVSQLFGDRAIIANATGCSSIYGGNLPTTPWAKNRAGRGPAWSNSLFEDNAEFGLGFRLAIDKQRQFAGELLQKLAPRVGEELAEAILTADQSHEAGIAAQRERVAKLLQKLDSVETPESFNLRAVAETLIRRSVWIIGGDGWAYDIGYGGLDHVLATGHDVNVLVLDTEVYSNTGGQMSKATPRGAVARFAAQGKPSEKKDLGLMAMAYGNVYVAQVAMGANDNQAVKTFVEAERYHGPSLIIAYSHCIAHGIDMRHGLDHQKAAVESGAWLLYRYDPQRAANGLNPLQLDSPEPKRPLEEYESRQNRFRVLLAQDPDQAKELLRTAQQAAVRRYQTYKQYTNGAAASSRHRVKTDKEG